MQVKYLKILPFVFISGNRRYYFLECGINVINYIDFRNKKINCYTPNKNNSIISFIKKRQTSISI